MAGTFTVTGMSAGLATGQKTIGPWTVTGSGLVGEILELNLSSGDNTITIPPNAIAVCIVPPSTNAQALKLRTNLDSGSGLAISATDPFGPYCWRGLSPTSLILNAAGAVTGVGLTFI